jgi:hypothetical protein
MDLRSLIAKMDAIEKLTEASDTLDASSKIASKIRKAVTGLGTDEEAVYDAIADVKDKYQWAEIKKIYPEIEDDILDDFSDLLAPELTHVKKLLARIGVTLKQDIVDNRAEMAKIKQLESLVDKYLSLKPTTTKESLSLSLYESFGYTTITEAAAAASIPGLVDTGANLSAWSKIKLAGGKVLGIGAVAVTAWEGWQQIKALPATLTEEQRKVEITKIISKLVAEIGTFWVGAVIGGAMAGAISGPGAIIGFIGGGLAANYLLGDDVNLIVDKIVDKLYGTAPRAAQQNQPATAQQNQPATAQQNQSSQLPAGADKDVAELQNLLKDEGATNLAVTGILDKDTVIAIQNDLIKLGAKNVDGTPLQADGKIGKNTAAALVQYYKVEV